MDIRVGGSLSKCLTADKGSHADTHRKSSRLEGTASAQARLRTPGAERNGDA